LEWVSRLLAETDLPLEKVVEHSGFNSLSHLSNVFRRKTGMTLAQYRRHTRPV
jgi:AraC-like DNA-binding protein